MRIPGRPYEYEFRPMLLVLMLMVYHRKDTERWRPT